MGFATCRLCILCCTTFGDVPSLLSIKLIALAVRMVEARVTEAKRERMMRREECLYTAATMIQRNERNAKHH